jgi:hypothetical protein
VTLSLKVASNAYTILDAMKDEVELLREQAKVEEKEDRFITVAL